MNDFTLYSYATLIDHIKAFCHVDHQSIIKLRHDIDRLPMNALKIARMESKVGVFGTYYFRTKPHTFKPDIIKEIAALGHQIGYHYENMSDYNGDSEKAIEDFKRNLDRLRKIVPIKTICMHGSPMSHYDNRDLWKEYDYHDFDIEFEPYFDVDFSKVYYLTDTGRRWDGECVNVRDRVDRGDREWPVYHSTVEIVRAFQGGTFPLPAMITIHPQRWTDNPLAWGWELLAQNVKNVAKRLLLRGR